MTKQRETTGDNDLPKRENKTQRQKDQARAARVELSSFSVPDRPGRPKGNNGYDYNRES